MSLNAIKSADWRASIAPDDGARLTSLECRVGDIWAPLVFGGVGQGCGAFPLVPFSGRVRDGHMKVAGHTWRAARGVSVEPHVVHGDACRRAWQVVTHEEQALKLDLSYPSPDWPFPHHVTQSLACLPTGFTVSLSVRGPQTLPFGLGWHPYFPMRGGAQLHIQSRQAIPFDSQGFPDRKRQIELSSPLTLEEMGGNTIEFDLISNSVRIDWVRDGLGLSMDCWGATTLVLHVPQSGDRFALEPANHPSGIFSAQDGCGQDTTWTREMVLRLNVVHL